MSVVFLQVGPVIYFQRFFLMGFGKINVLLFVSLSEIHTTSGTIKSSPLPQFVIHPTCGLTFVFTASGQWKSSGNRFQICFYQMYSIFQKNLNGGVLIVILNKYSLSRLTFVRPEHDLILEKKDTIGTKTFIQLII